MLRAAVLTDSPLSREIKRIMESGALVSDDIMIRLVKQRIQQDDCRQGFLLDGFPRTLAQAEALEHAHIILDCVVELAVDDEHIVQRLGGRWIHPSSGRSYHTIFNPPKKTGLDDVSGEALIQRDDDNEQTARKRLSVYHEQTKPLLAHYQQLSQQRHKPIFKSIDGTGSVEAVSARLFAIFDACDHTGCHHRPIE
jgi:adenylate kinase